MCDNKDCVDGAAVSTTVKLNELSQQSCELVNFQPLGVDINRCRLLNTE